MAWCIIAVDCTDPSQCFAAVVSSEGGFHEGVGEMLLSVEIEIVYVTSVAVNRMDCTRHSAWVVAVVVGSSGVCVCRVEEL